MVWSRHTHVSLLLTCVPISAARDGSSGRNLSLIRISKVAVFSQKLVQSKGLIRRSIKENFNDHCQAGFDPSGLQRDVTDMPSRNGHTPRCTRVLRSFMWLAPKCGTSTAIQKGALLTFHTASRGSKRKKVKLSTAEESNIDWLDSDLYSNLTKQIESSHKYIFLSWTTWIV